MIDYLPDWNDATDAQRLELLRRSLQALSDKVSEILRIAPQ
jgi:hypothetical protein